MSENRQAHIQSALQLLEARKEALDQFKRSNMRAHGKMLGKDLFTWFDCELESLTNTLLSFPFPVIWICRKEEVMGVQQVHLNVSSHLHTVIVYGEKEIRPPYEWAENLLNLRLTDELGEALDSIASIDVPKSLVLVTGTIKDWQENQEKIERFIEMMKG